MAGKEGGGHFFRFLYKEMGGYKRIRKELGLPLVPHITLSKRNFCESLFQLFIIENLDTFFLVAYFARHLGR